MLTFALLVWACIALHLLTIAGVAKIVGVTVRQVSLGVGPTLFETGVFRFAAIPTGGFVNFRDSRQEPVPPGDMATAFDGRSTLEQVVIAVSGCAALLAVAVVCQGQAALQAFVDFPLQLLHGALSPFDGAQTLLEGAARYLRSATALAVTGTVAAKMAALNLLPLPAMNGGAVIAIMARRAGLQRWWPPAATQLLFFVFLGLFAAWGLALVACVFKT